MKLGDKDLDEVLGRVVSWPRNKNTYIAYIQALEPIMEALDQIACPVMQYVTRLPPPTSVVWELVLCDFSLIR